MAKVKQTENHCIEKIKSQLEFYFSDVNLAFDEFMIKNMKKHKR